MLHVLNHPLPDEIKVLNVNFPNGVESDTESKIVKLCPVKYVDEPIPATDPRGVSVYWLWGKTIANLHPDTDSYVLIHEKKITITPITLDLGKPLLKYLKDYFTKE